MIECPRCERPMAEHSTVESREGETLVLERKCPVDPEYEVKTFGTVLRVGSEWELLSAPELIVTPPGGDHFDPLASERCFAVKVYARRRVSPVAA